MTDGSSATAMATASHMMAPSDVSLSRMKGLHTAWMSWPWGRLETSALARKSSKCCQLSALSFVSSHETYQPRSIRLIRVKSLRHHCV